MASPGTSSRSTQDASRLQDMLPSPLDKDLWTASLTTANDRLRVNKRQALVGYLLQQPYFQDPKVNVFDTDSLFGFFLIDVQMGSCLQTSRTRQAVSTIQLFVQRCLLGLEGFPGNAIDQEFKNRWDWMQRYRLWEAYRQIFLYPENVIDPSLRDNKTDLFSTLEKAVMQDDANLNTATQAIKDYVYGANEVADLNIQAYLWQSTTAFRGRFHLFGCSKSAPFHHYYRYMDMTGPDASDPYIVWSPWQEIQVDIATLTTNPDGSLIAKPGSYLIPVLWKGRLYLFLPQITVQKLQNQDLKPQSGNVPCGSPPPANPPRIVDMQNCTMGDLGSDRIW